MNPLEAVDLVCPYCSEPFSLMVDCSGGDQEYTEDCPVCCAPVAIRVVIGNTLEVSVERESD
ncbi:CPXCG motif-containing cysteine-rich protein [Nitrincola iocasae]|uniref:CPXCG motif-containing cysteine-rich protein n=1 Tax=Nitrincola iocasae TaxID=2614693 RepID=A0A5J6L9S7_9GAMM|nr:CPXCG motif-containing cysteine-rich protein [Nitrincola iocasae]QEW05126.1 CPXCG motif-containing cysteine-rich protein [Nitrincola iocasae]